MEEPRTRAVAVARELLAAELGCADDALTIVRVEEVDWSDSSLGCPEPGMMYMQVIIPGYKLTFSDSTRSYEVHTGRQGTPAVWCDHAGPRRLG